MKSADVSESIQMIYRSEVLGKSFYVLMKSSD